MNYPLALYSRRIGHSDEIIQAGLIHFPHKSCLDEESITRSRCAQMFARSSAPDLTANPSFARTVESINNMNYLQLYAFIVVGTLEAMSAGLGAAICNIELACLCSLL